MVEIAVRDNQIVRKGQLLFRIDPEPYEIAVEQADRARLDLAYTRIIAPDDGIVAKVDDLQPGDFAHSGAAVFSMMSTRRIWVEANFRETGLTHMRPGQRATVNVDANSGQVSRRTSSA